MTVSFAISVVDLLYMIAFANIRKSSFSSWTELTIPFGGVFRVVAGRVAKVEELAGGVAAANGSVVGVMAGVPIEVLVIAAVPDLTAALMPVTEKLVIWLVSY